jgi:hypothetical protein
MYKECRHILPGGRKCRAAALRGPAFCYYHTASRRLSVSISSAGAVLLPPVEDAASVQVAVNQVLHSLGERRISHREAGVFFYGLRIASGLARRAEPDPNPADTVRDLCDDPKEGIIGLEKTICEPPGDCVECPRRKSCKDYLAHSEEDRTDHRGLREAAERDPKSDTGNPNSIAGRSSGPSEALPTGPLPENPTLIEFPGCEEFYPDLVREYYRGSGIEPPAGSLSPPRRR